MAPRFNIPKRQFCEDPKKMISIRMPEKLIEELDRQAKHYGWSTTDIIITALDQFVVWSRKQQKDGKSL